MLGAELEALLVRERKVEVEASAQDRLIALAVVIAAVVLTSLIA